MQKLATGAYNDTISRVVKAHTGSTFQISNIQENTADAMHDAARFDGGNTPVFVKAGHNPFSLDQFTQEAASLSYLRTHTATRAPEPYGVAEQDGVALLVMEAIDAVPPQTDADWEVLGRGLAQLHRTTSDRCGLHMHTYLGIFRQDNTPMTTWEAFFGERRLRDTMRMAVDAGNLPISYQRQVERLIDRLPEICGPVQPFSLLHGDPWPGNLLFDGRQMIAIDCSLYYGNREIDLSTVDFFFPVNPRFFDAYHEAYPIDPGYGERKSLWRINQWLGHVTLFGESYLPKLTAAMAPYL